MTLVVIPYLASGAQGSEIELAVAGWLRHFREDFRLVVVGDDPHLDGVTFIECPRISVPPGCTQYIPHLDHVNKFRTVHRYYPRSRGFIYTCDDIYAVRDFTLADVRRLKYRKEAINNAGILTNRWVMDNWKTRGVLLRDGLPTRNWVCHLPVWYDWHRLEAIWDRYGCDNTSYVVEQLYFNTYYGGADADCVEAPGQRWQFKAWGDATPEQLRESLDRVTWVCNSYRGWRPWLEEILAERYGIVYDSPDSAII